MNYYKNKTFKYLRNLNVSMGTITINVDNKTEEIFRKTVSEKLGTGKGKLGTAVTEALYNWVEINQEENIQKRQLEMMEKGFKLGRYKFDRDKIHKR
ncbi:MAG: hypothetical protein Q8Q35_02830 [Nanoarchaeota archaeon]|nr:hypothetical protein [Nanoarchaeota archaeon]